MSTVANFLSVLPKGTPPELLTAIGDAARDALDRHGLSAFIAPREAALAHEAGHAIVGAHEGLAIRAVTICSRSVALVGRVWGGRCIEAGAWTTGPDTTAEDDLRRARFVIAGLAGEAVTGLDTPASSLDELALSQFVNLNAAAKLADSSLSNAEYSAYAQRLWHDQVWGVAITILRANHEPFTQLAGHLNQHTRVQGAKLRKVLAQVKRIAP
jgi:hypothetical protein